MSIIKSGNSQNLLSVNSDKRALSQTIYPLGDTRKYIINLEWEEFYP